MNKPITPLAKKYFNSYKDKRDGAGSYEPYHVKAVKKRYKRKRIHDLIQQKRFEEAEIYQDQH